MAIEPLYNASKDALLSRVRIKTADDEQTLDLVDLVIQEVRLGFFSAITKERAKTIAGYALVENPDSDEEILRVNAAVVEANWVTLLLAQRLPMIVMDNTASVRDNFNEEPLTRDSGAVKDFIKELKASVDKGLGDLASPTDANKGSVKSSLNGPDDDYLISENFVGLGTGRNLMRYTDA